LAQPYWQANILHFYYPSHTYVVLSYEFSFFRIQRSCNTLPGYDTTETKAQTCSRAPFNRFLFRLSPCVNLFYCLLLFNHPMGSIPTEDTAVFGIWPRQTKLHVPRNKGLKIGSCQPIFFYKRPNTLGSVRRHEFGRICISSESCLCSKCWVCPAPGFAALRSAIIRLRQAKGELLRLCPGYSG
jgi:hypothetical protein